MTSGFAVGQVCSSGSLMVQQYAEVYTEFKFPDRLPLSGGKSRNISIFIRDPEEWSKDMITRFARGTKKLNVSKLVPRMKEEILGELSLNIKLLKSKKVSELYGATEFLLGANKLLEAALGISADEAKLKKCVSKTISFRKILSNRPTSVVVFGTVQAREIVNYGVEVHQRKELNEILEYRAFIDEYLSYLMSFDASCLPDKPIATFEEIDDVLGRRG